jgi:hypothetical protein
MAFLEMTVFLILSHTLVGRYCAKKYCRVEAAREERDQDSEEREFQAQIYAYRERHGSFPWQK